MKNLQRYIGRIIRVTPARFALLAEAARRKGHAIENCFVVAAASVRQGWLVCYGSDTCVRLRPADVILV